MKIAIMQPYFLPYIGYFQLIAAVDLFIVYDNIKYTKKGWINRNRLLQNASDAIFSVPLQKDADTLPIDQRVIAKDFDPAVLLNRFSGAYRRAPYFASTYALLERIMHCDNLNLFHFLHHAIKTTCAHLQISTTIQRSSTIDADHGLKGQDRVIAMCLAAGASVYINAIGGVELYSREHFANAGLDLKFLASKPLVYRQFDESFVPWLSIIDVMMFNAPELVQRAISTNFDLV